MLLEHNMFVGCFNWMNFIAGLLFCAFTEFKL